MKALPWLKTYIGDEAALTLHLNSAEFGAYERLRRHYWQHGSLPEVAERMARITGVDLEKWPAIWGAIEPLLVNFERLDFERGDAAAKRERKITAGRKGAQKRWGDGRINGNANGFASGKPNGSASAENGKSNGLPNDTTNGSPVATSTSTRDAAYEEKVDPTHARGDIPAFSNAAQFREWLSEKNVFPGDFDLLVRKWMDDTLSMEDVLRSAA
ncbi:MAG: DUF1376 domain-containing protein [Rhizobiaceae bacterium]|nr:DUF1376 domain-containing protein [Rhizobiaceae bacterium]